MWKGHRGVGRVGRLSVAVSSHSELSACARTTVHMRGLWLLDGRRTGLIVPVTWSHEADTVRARASEEALRIGHECQPDHLLFGVLTEEEGSASRCFRTLGVPLDAAQKWVRSRLFLQVDERQLLGDKTIKDSKGSCGLTYAPETAAVQEVARVEAERLGAGKVRSGHVLLALLRSQASSASALFEQLSVDATRLHRALLDELDVSAEHRERYLRQVSVAAKATRDPDRFRLSPEGVRALSFGEADARRRGHPWFGCEHLLLGVLVEGSQAARVLSGFGATLEEVRSQTDAYFALKASRGEARWGRVPDAPLTPTPRALTVIRLAEVEGERLGAAGAGGCHLVLALLFDGESLAWSILRSLGVGHKALRDALLAALMVPPDVRCAYSRAREAADTAIDEHQLALQAAFADALASPHQLDDRISQLLAAGTPVVVREKEGIERLRARSTAAGFSVIDASGNGTGGYWVFANPLLREIVLLVARKDSDDGSVVLAVGGRDLGKVPTWMTSQYPGIAKG